MSLTDQDKTTVRAFWNLASGKADLFGGEALTRMILLYPGTRAYFPDWKDFTPKSAPVKKHVKELITGINTAIAQIDNLSEAMADLGNLHAKVLKVDFVYMKNMSDCLLLGLAVVFPKEFTPEVNMSMFKFLEAMNAAIGEKYT
ncbi:hemoglobin subunit alpha-1-like [Syngnathoides biaculeatus]|uniref:hemoglobin subunit alpha-1-like n=1 Tax=Syngnathoides biaculeatus TaxID=300417 RepID=UPI002ADE0AA9|nr:hemoglobin subunit alpha-1-like [Syngnathoides biaculeatus]